MLRALVRSTTVASKCIYSPRPNVVLNVRFFADNLSIPSDKEQQAGRRKEELEAQEAGFEMFNNDPIIPSTDAGTKENPILVSIRFYYEVLYFYFHLL
jgi:hypothetical protein